MNSESKSKWTSSKCVSDKTTLDNNFIETPQSPVCFMIAAIEFVPVADLSMVSVV